MIALSRTSIGQSADLRGRAAARFIGALVEGAWTNPHMRAVAHRELTSLGSYGKEAAARFVVSNFCETTREWTSEAQPLEHVRSFALELSHNSYINLHAPGMLTAEQLEKLDELPVLPTTHILNPRRLRGFVEDGNDPEAYKKTQRRMLRRTANRPDNSGSDSFDAVSEAESVCSRPPLSCKKQIVKMQDMF